MSSFRNTLVLSLLIAGAAPAHAQIIHCIDPPTSTPSEAACRIETDAATKELRLVLQVRAENDAPVAGQVVSFESTNGVVPITATTDARGYVAATWQGSITPEPIVVMARASLNGVTMTRQVRISRRTPAPLAYISRMSPAGDHSAFAGRFLSDDIEAEITASPAVCSRTTVVFEYISVGTGAAPAPVRYESSGLWSELDKNRFGCAARLRWPLSSAAGKQTLRAWIKRDSATILPNDSAEAQRYLRPHDVRAVAHALPALLAGAAVIEAGDTRDSSSIATLVGVSLSLPTIADFLKHHGAQGPGDLLDRTRLFIGTDFGDDPGKNVYLGADPLVLFLGARAADIPVAFTAGRRVGDGKDRWFGAGFVNASTLLETVLKGIGISK